VRGAFDVVAANDVVAEGLAEAKRPEFRSLSLTGPRLASARIPIDPGMEMRITMESMNGGSDFSAYPRFYIPYATDSPDAAARGKPLTELAKSSAENAEDVAKLVNASGKPVESLVYLPLHTRSGVMAIVLGKPEGDVVGVLRAFVR
jgi:hypothetical protein